MNKTFTSKQKMPKKVKGKLPNKFLYLEHGDKDTLTEEIKNTILDYFVWHKLENGTVMLRLVPSKMYIGISVPINPKDRKAVKMNMANALMNEIVRRVEENDELKAKKYLALPKI